MQKTLNYTWGEEKKKEKKEIKRERESTCQEIVQDRVWV